MPGSVPSAPDAGAAAQPVISGAPAQAPGYYAQPQQPAYQGQPYPGQPGPGYSGGGNSRKKLVTAVAASLAAVLVLAGCLWFFVFNKDDDANRASGNSMDGAAATAVVFKQSTGSDSASAVIDRLTSQNGAGLVTTINEVSSPAELGYMESILGGFNGVTLSKELTGASSDFNLDNASEAIKDFMAIYDEFEITFNGVKAQEVVLGPGISAMYLTEGTMDVKLKSDANASRSGRTPTCPPRWPARSPTAFPLIRKNSAGTWKRRWRNSA